MQEYKQVRQTVLNFHAASVLMIIQSRANLD